MSEDTKSATDAAAAAAAAAPATDAKPAETKPAPKPRAPKLVAKVNGRELAVLKYPFPVKAQKFPIKVNGVAVDAATTGGRGNSYTYFIVNGTSFYVGGALDIDAEVAIEFPEGYEFATTGERKSYYKPKKGAKAGEGEAAAASDSKEASAGGEAAPAASSASGTGEAAPAPAPAPEAPKAARRAKK